MCQYCAVSSLTAGERGQKFDDSVAKIYRQNENVAQLNHDRIHFPVATIERDVEERFGQAQMRHGTDRQKFREALDDAEQNREEVVVQKASELNNLIIATSSWKRRRDRRGSNSFLFQFYGSRGVPKRQFRADYRLRFPSRCVGRLLPIGGVPLRKVARKPRLCGGTEQARPS